MSHLTNSKLSSTAAPETIPIEFHQQLHAATLAARMAGKLIVDMLESMNVREKGDKDLVTDADVAAEKLIREQLVNQFPTYLFIGEETPGASLDVLGSHNRGSTKEKTKGNDDLEHSPWCWVVDPIDGTANYVHRFPNFAVSIALVHEGNAKIGVVYDPMGDEIFTSVSGYGAQLNGRAIENSHCRSMNKALIAASFPPNVRRGSKEIDQFIQVIEASQSVRRLGSAALNLCYVACGRLDGYWAGTVRPWDVAAGALIAIESGCTLTSLTNTPFDLRRSDLVVAASKELHSELYKTLQ